MSYRANFVDISSIGERLVRGRVTSSTSIAFDRRADDGVGRHRLVAGGVPGRHRGPPRLAALQLGRGAARRVDLRGGPRPRHRRGRLRHDGRHFALCRRRSARRGVLHDATGERQHPAPAAGIHVDTADVGWFVVYWRGHPPAFEQDLTDRSNAEGDLISLASPATDLDGDTARLLGHGPAARTGASTRPPGRSRERCPTTPPPDRPTPWWSGWRTRGGLFATDSFTWTITNTNRAPVVTGPARPHRRRGHGGVAGR